ncbi:MAG TPA: hypothetical protein PLJ21_11460, partial [Pseudobdellovibrionaceae bacterium]|nr:hypothetical protein [Pseudobdellovibrionaceae bacterium]
GVPLSYFLKNILLFKIKVLILILSSPYLWAAGSCLELEGINLGCVSSIDHTCTRNIAVNSPNTACHYVGDPNVSYRVEGPIAFNCKSSKNTTVCKKNEGNGDQAGETCVTHSECYEYFPPTCRETCIPCFDTIVTEKIGVSKGCLICTRKPCADEKERLLISTCPIQNSLGMPLGPNNKCSSNSLCPKSATPPNGGPEMPVTIIKGSCEPPKLPINVNQPPPKLCIWKVDKRSATGCEPIEPENLNP